MPPLQVRCAVAGTEGAGALRHSKVPPLHRIRCGGWWRVGGQSGGTCATVAAAAAAGTARCDRNRSHSCCGACAGAQGPTLSLRWAGISSAEGYCLGTTPAVAGVAGIAQRASGSGRHCCTAAIWGCRGRCIGGAHTEALSIRAAWVRSIASEDDWTTFPFQQAVTPLDLSVPCWR